MHLVSALAAGVAGCENGTATLVYRGTASVATYYTDFEGTSAVATGTVALDSRGGAVIYVADLVTFTCKSSGGSTIRTFTEGADDGAVEVRTTSFDGAAYSGGAIAPGNPTTLKAVLDRWLTSAGTTNFNVLLAGVATTLQSALGALWRSRVFDVKAYGALGDGATNDINAINAAASAANTAGGGTVFFPPGTYLISAALTTFSTVEYVGSGVTLSTIRTSTDVPVAAVGAAFPRGFSNLAFTTAAASHTYWLNQASGAGNSLIADCSFADTTASAGGNKAFRNASASQQRYVRCTLGVSTNADGILSVTGDGARTICEDCSLSITNANAYLAFVGAGSTMATLVLARCQITYSSNNVANRNNGVGVLARSTTHVVGCTLTPAASRESFVFQINSATSTYVYESGNNFSASYAALTPSLVPQFTPYQFLALPTLVHMGTRELAAIAPDSPNSSPITLYSSSAARHVIRTTSGAGTRLIACDPLYIWGVDGMPLSLAVHNDTGASITYQWSTGFSTSGSTFAVAANSVRAFSFVFIAERQKFFLVSDTAGAETAE